MCHPVSTKVRTSCPARKRRRPTGTFLSNRMRNAMTVGVAHNCLDAILWNLKLLRDFLDAHAILEVIDNCADRHSRTSQYRSPAMNAWLGFDQGAFRPVDIFFVSCHKINKSPIKKIIAQYRCGWRFARAHSNDKPKHKERCSPSFFAPRNHRSKILQWTVGYPARLMPLASFALREEVFPGKRCGPTLRDLVCPVGNPYLSRIASTRSTISPACPR